MKGGARELISFGFTHYLVWRSIALAVELLLPRLHVHVDAVIEEITI